MTRPDFRNLPRAACLMFMLAAACSPSDPQPHYGARVTTVYNEQITVSHVTFRYWWQERGETPFLRDESLMAKEVIFEMMQPLKDNPSRVQVVTERISFGQADSISFDLTENGKLMTVATRDGRRLQAPMGFPKILRKDPSAGIADGKIYACGITVKDGKKTEFQLQLDYIKHIQFTGSTNS